MGTPIPENRAELTIAEIVRETGGRLYGAASPTDVVCGVSTDTRVIAPGQAFVAIAGESFDAHDHLDAALARGARLAIVEREVRAPEGLACVRVGSTVTALGELARFVTRRWRKLEGERRVIGITGSAGKTTTRVAVAALLEAIAPGEVLATTGNLNNQIGAPMTLLGLTPRHRFAVVEIGTNRPGEIGAIASVVEPDAAILTLIAAAHVEGFGSIDAIAEEKEALFGALPHDGIAVGYGDDSRVREALGRAAAHRRVTYGTSAGDDYRIVRREAERYDRARVRITRASPPGPASPASIEFTTPLLGEAGALACAAAIAVVERMLGHAVSAALMTEAMGRAEVGGGAGRLVPRVFADGLMVIDDSYNANPASMCASIRAAAEIARAEERSLALVLGEMRELGAASAEGHDAVGRAAGESGARLVIAVQGDAARIANEAKNGGADAVFVPDVARAADVARELISNGDVVLVKGSRGVATERVIAALEAAHGGERRHVEGAA
jgi:UDP-N-acetylmuramoyl-tripeptide--D-alanyl-D-alanine ligase